MDAFQRAVENARRQLGMTEGRQISLSELLRRAGFSERPEEHGGLTMKGARYHLEPGNNAKRKGGHRVPAELVDRLAAVLPVSVDDLQRAAQTAAGFTLDLTQTGRSDIIPAMLARYLGDEEVSDAEKQQTAARLLVLLAEQTARIGKDLSEVPKQ